jgi:hypothetical protein
MRPFLVRVVPIIAVLLLYPLAASAQEIRGQVVDSVTGQPLAGAVVTLLDVSGAELERSVSDESGRFLFVAIDVVKYRLRVEGEGYRTSTFPEWEVVPGRSRSYILLLPSVVTSPPAPDSLGPKLAAVCGTSDPTRPTIAGWVRHAGTGEPVREATVAASWATLPQALVQNMNIADYTGMLLADSSGFYAICNAPLNTRISFHAMSADGVSDFQDVTFGESGVVAGGEARFAPTWVWRQDLELASLEDHHTVLLGLVTDGTTGDPVAGAEVELRGTVFGGTTDREGRFRIENLPAGPAQLIIRQIGHQPLRQEIVLPDDATLALPGSALVLGRAAQMLDPLFVETTASHSPLTEFNRRREESPTGAFITRDEWERTGHVTDPIQVLRRLRGIQIQPGPDITHQWLVSMRRTTSRTAQLMIAREATAAVDEQVDAELLATVECPPLVFLDRHYLGNTNDVNLNLDIPIGDVIAVEAHQSTGSMPMEFNRRGAACGVIAFWTRYAQPETVAVTDDTSSLFKSTAFHFGAALAAVLAIFLGLGESIAF